MSTDSEDGLRVNSLNGLSNVPARMLTGLTTVMRDEPKRS
jgi:hypothetical protein